VSLGIDCDPIEQGLIAKRAVQFSPQYWLKIDYLLRSVVKDDAQGVRRDDLETQDAAYRVCHRHSSLILAAQSERLRENLGAVEWNLTTEQAARLDAVSKVTPIYPYWHQRDTASDRNPPLV
jgi:hypothetical protein